MRLVIAMMRHETNTFSPVPTMLKSFAHASGMDAPVSGDEAIAVFGGTNNPLAAFLDLAREEGAEVVVPVAADASPSGRVAAAAFETMAGQICDAVAAGCDAALLDLHGAMVTESHDDGEGELLRRVRAVAPDLPIAVALDFHSNLGPEMMANASVITGYCTYPHIDMYETGMRAGRTLLGALEGAVKPAMVWRSLPMLTHTVVHSPSRQPMKDVMDKAISAEAAGSVLNASVFGGFPQADIPHVGLSAIVVADGDTGAAQALLDDLLALAWQRRADFVFESEPLEESIAYAKSLAEGPVVLADHGDNTASGGTQDVMAPLAEVMRQELDDVVAGPYCDPQSVARMIAAGEGAAVTLELGGKIDMPMLGLEGEPLTVSGTVARITDGRFKVTGPMMTGMTVDLGRTAVLDAGAVQIVVSEERSEPYDLGVFTHAGIDPTRKKYVLIKSRQHFRAGFEPIARHIVMVAGPGVTGSDIALFPYKDLRRPIYPIDPDTVP
ncbi:MAG: M81 family metallopeptidase [Alphaproteobacteria bacterium]